jgi:hypothetical protein
VTKQQARRPAKARAAKSFEAQPLLSGSSAPLHATPTLESEIGAEVRRLRKGLDPWIQPRVQIFSYCFAGAAAAIRFTTSITVSGRSSWTSWPLPCATIKLPCGERLASCCWSRIRVGSHCLK